MASFIQGIERMSRKLMDPELGVCSRAAQVIHKCRVQRAEVAAQDFPRGVLYRPNGTLPQYLLRMDEAGWVLASRRGPSKNPGSHFNDH